MNKKKIIMIIIILILVIAFIFLCNLGRKVYILSKYSEKTEEYSKLTNFYKKMHNDSGITTEFWRKDDLGFLKMTSNDFVRMIYWGKDYNWIVVDDKDGKTAVKMVKEDYGFGAQTLTTGTLYMENMWDKIKMAFSSKITTEKLNNINCYKFSHNKDWQMFINKDSFLVMREINGSTDTGFIEYRLNEVRDEDVLMPNLAGYTINDTTQK
ncbi:MAG: hypothetical protein IKF38_02855 [Clostridia bacterium]|nr:hypothetical protein [Clostridia bacterium]